MWGFAVRLQSIAFWGYLIQEQINLISRILQRVYLKISPYSIVDSARVGNRFIDFGGSISDSNTPSQNYYLLGKRQERTWRACEQGRWTGLYIRLGFSYELHNSISAIITTIIRFWFGTKYCIYSGDVNADRTVDALGFKSDE